MSLLSGRLSALAFDSDTRLYRLEGEGAVAELMVEAWGCREPLDSPWQLEISALSLEAGLDLHGMLGQRLALQCVLADASLHTRTGIVTAAASEDADGGFARYSLTVRPWIALLTHTRQSRVWQETSFVELIDSVLRRYAHRARWRWAGDIGFQLARSPHAGTNAGPSGWRSYAVQYRETDFDFVARLLAEEGISWYVEEDDQAPSGHTVVFFAYSVDQHSCPEDLTSRRGSQGLPGIRFHRASAVERSDTIQLFGDRFAFHASRTTVLSWDYACKRSTVASVPTLQGFGGHAPYLEQYEPAPPYAFATNEQASRAAVLRQEAIEARHRSFFGRGTVRTLRAGRRFALLGGPHEEFDHRSINGRKSSNFFCVSVTSVGINNLPKALSDRVAATFDAAGAKLLPEWIEPDLRTQAEATGFANAFEAIPAEVPWRPAAVPRPKASGALLATVVGAQGSKRGDIHTDRLGRVRIRHDFQEEGQGSTWVRVMQADAGPGMGVQFIPRVGQQVLLGFFDDDMTLPFVQGALYTGQGEGGIAATPGERPRNSDDAAFGRSRDHRAAGQANLVGGNSPPWHGAAAAAKHAGGQSNTAALSGWKTQELQGDGFNQLVFDDTNRQLRTQLATTQHATQLNLGHLVHQADNHRGSFRGLGLELRTDAYGTLRGQQGVLLSTFGIQQGEPAGDNAAGIALAGQLKSLAEVFSDAARVHQTVPLASAIGSIARNSSALDASQAPAAALHTALKGMVAAASPEAALGDAIKKNTSVDEDKLPHTTDPLVAITAKAGLVISAGQDVICSADETVLLGAGQDASLATGGNMRIHSNQAIGVLAGAVAPGDKASGRGITMIAAQGPIDMQAQTDAMQIASKGDLGIQSKSAHVGLAAAKKVVLETKGGARVTLEDGNVTFECPGTLTVKSSTKSFEGPERVAHDLPLMRRSVSNREREQAVSI